MLKKKLYDIKKHLESKTLHFSVLYCSLPWIFSKLFYTWKVLISIFSGHWERKHKTTIYSFSFVDIKFRSWYNKIAQDLYSRGRFGYIWDNALGMSLANLTYNNLGTYTVLRKLGLRKSNAWSFTSMLIVLLVLFTISFPQLIPILFLLVFLFLLGASPEFISIFTHIGKQEGIVYSSSLLCMYLLFTEQFIFAGLIWSAIAFINLPASIMLILYAGLPSLVFSVVQGGFWVLALSMLPGIIKTVIRLLPMWVTGYMQSITSEQKGLWKIDSWFPKDKEKYQLWPVTLSLLLTSVLTLNIYAALALVAALFVFLANRRILYYNDESSTSIHFFMLAMAFACASQCIYAIIPLLFWGYTPSRCFAFPQTILDNSTLTALHMPHVQWLDMYPCIYPMPYLFPNNINQFFNALPDNARFVTEFDGDPRQASHRRTFWCVIDTKLYERNLNYVNGMYLRIVQPKLANNIFEKLSSEHMSGDSINRVLATLGVNYIVVYNKRTLKDLLAIGYTICAAYNAHSEDIFRIITHAPVQEIFLLKAKEERGVVDGASDLRYLGSNLIWTAQKDVEYKVKYEFIEGFSATINEKPLTIKTYTPFIGINLKFMIIKADEDGELRLSFQAEKFPSWRKIWNKIQKPSQKIFKK